MTSVGTLNGTGEVGNNLVMGGKNARAGAPDTGLAQGQSLAAAELAHRQHYVTPSYDESMASGITGSANRDGGAARRDLRDNAVANGIPSYYNQFDGLPVAYSAPSAQKENMVLRQAIREAAGQNLGDGVMRTDPITDEEVSYLKSMKDQAELAKFDDYVETYIDPRQPGNMKWLMEIYPDYVNRRLQQAHTDYEFALRNQMIDSWGINTFDDLHFKYLVDQGKITGPRLMNRRGEVDSSYTPGWLSPFNFQSPNKDDSMMALPFASARHGRRPGPGQKWELNRSGRPLGKGNTENELAAAMYANDRPGPDDRFIGGASRAGDALVGGRMRA